METRFISVLTTIILISFVACKKDKKKVDSHIQPAPPDPTASFNPPPAGSDFYMINYENQGLSWTNDFITFNKYSSKIDESSCFGYIKDTVIVYSNNKISFGSISNPKDHKEINCSKSLHEISMINGVITCYGTDGVGRYLGYCDFRNGETQVTFTNLTNGEYYYGFSNLGHAVVAVMNQSASNFTLTYTRDGKNWINRNVSGFSSSTLFRKFNNVFYGYSSASYMSTSDTSFKESSWFNYHSFTQYNNTSDSAGIFNYNFTRRNSSTLVLLGHVNTPSGNKLPAKNVSLDNGVTFTTSLLNNVPSNYWRYALTSTHTGVFVFDNLNNNYIPFVSTDQISFSSYPAKYSYYFFLIGDKGYYWY